MAMSTETWSPSPSRNFCPTATGWPNEFHRPRSKGSQNVSVNGVMKRRFALQNATVSIHLESTFCSKALLSSFSPTVSPATNETPVLKAYSISSFKTEATFNHIQNSVLRSWTLVGSIGGPSISLSVSRRWEEKRSRSTVRRPTKYSSVPKRAINGPRIRPVDLSILRPYPSGMSAEDSLKLQDPEKTLIGDSIYRPFVDFAAEELIKHADVSPLILKEEFKNMVAKDNTARIDNMAFTSSKIRVFRIASIHTESSMQVLNVAGFARLEYDLPIFCADFFSVPNKNIIVLDLNPLYNTNSDSDYKERYFKDLMPLANKYTQLLPWGDKLTAESLQFFSPIVIWTKAQEQDLTRGLYHAFQDYLVAWLNMVDSAQPTGDTLAIARNQEAQHRYISWRTTKDPGRPLLKKLFGEQMSERYIKEFLFSDLNTLGTKSFLDYFPEYTGADGSICKQRSMIGKLFEKRPWDKYGHFCPI